jgi:hypothetical protein
VLTSPNLDQRSNIMKRQIAAILCLALAAGIAPQTTAAGLDTTQYGRAGGPIGIAAVIANASPDTSLNTRGDAKQWFGRAGGPVGADAIATVVATARPSGKRGAQVAWYGRAGKPLPFGV